MKEIKVLGPGCKRCETTAQMIKDQADALGVAITLTKVTDMAEIAMAGIMSTPGIIIDDKIVHSGGLPSEENLKAWLEG